MYIYGFEIILLITPIHIELNRLYMAHALVQDLTMYSTFCIPVILTLTSESEFRRRNLRLGFENCFENRNFYTHLGTSLDFRLTYT